jgi:heme oxygenase (mycobilin-producing)
VLVVTRFVVAEAESDAFVARAHTALVALAARPGYRAGRLARALDEPDRWVLVLEWDSVGAYRRALSSYEVKVQATPLLAEALDEPSAFEVLASAAPGGGVEVSPSDRAPAANDGSLRSRA